MEQRGLLAYSPYLAPEGMRRSAVTYHIPSIDDDDDEYYEVAVWERSFNMRVEIRLVCHGPW